MEDNKNKDNHETEIKDPETDNNEDNHEELSFEKLTNEITTLREENKRIKEENKDLKNAYNTLYEKGSFHEKEDKPQPKAKTLSYDDIII